jgi:hypothetical protein
MGYYGDHMKDMRDALRAEKREATRALLGTKDKDGRLYVEYRSKVGKLGVYLLVRNAEFRDKETGELVKRCLLAFPDGGKMPDGKEGFWVDRGKVIFTNPASQPGEDIDARTAFDDQPGDLLL